MDRILENFAWRAGALLLFGVLVVLGMLAFRHRDLPPSDLSSLCDQLFWPEGGMRDRILIGYRPPHNILEDNIGSGGVVFARSQITPEAWAAAHGLGEATRWPGVVFQVSWAGLFPKGYAARVIRAKAGDQMGLWIFATSGKESRSDTYVGHPGGNSGKPFETIFLRWASQTVALNVLHRPDRRLENFVFRLDEKKSVCRVVSER